MNKKNEHLNDCLERLLRGEEMESCLKGYPEEAEVLRPLLETALGVRRYAESVELCPEFIAQTQAKLGKAYESRYYSWKARLAGILSQVGRFAAVAATAIVILAFAFTAGLALSVLASEDTMPGQALYPVKLATEQIRIAFAFPDAEKIALLTQFAEIRAEEIAYAAEKGDTVQVEAALERLEAHLSEVENIYGQDTTPSVVAAPGKEPTELQSIESTVKSSFARAEAKLKKAEIPALEKDEIIARVDRAYSKAIEAIQSAR